MPDGQDTTAHDATELKVIDWVEKNVGGKVTKMERQQRWRPAWFVDVKTPKGLVELYVRGDRTSKSIAAPFEQEYELLKILEENDIPVPHIYGLCPDPVAIVMAKAPGRHNLATAVDEAERNSVMDHYIDILVKLHAIDPQKFVKAGLVYPKNPRTLALHQFDQYVGMYRATKRRPEPMLEYMINWVRRNVPENRDTVSFLCCDVAQFLFDKGKVTAVIDFEMSYLGDPLQDLSAMQTRDTNEPLGDLGRALRRYEAGTGKPIDANAFDFHAIEFAIITPISLAESLSRPLPMGSVVQYQEWWIHFARMPLELMALRGGIPLPALPPLKTEPSQYGVMAESLVGAVNALAAAPGAATFERDAAANLAKYLARAALYAPAIAQQDLRDTEAVLGRKFDNWQDADAALEEFAAKAGPEHDKDLIPLFYRRMQRQAEVILPFITRPEVLNPLKPFNELVGRN